ncbi:hypothetical protein A8C32_00430 [Flavivirga aquatica]|uniref:Uncharacterized protein n=1 Tax=Flavivirga aquatica TaxID=1849968 RepID=A0A1E5TBP5_9FLAO|nr:phosphoribosyltransferase family protein [Flavivirga aquatica]OEK08778.1 hypothetical protein A8C32_00430 [Flavivirga aquatica]
MEVITLNNETFFEKCSELMSRVDFKPDTIVGILNGGGYVVNGIKKGKEFESVQFKLIKLQRDNWLKNVFLIKLVLSVLPCKISDRLRIFESKKAKKVINKLNLDQLSNYNIDFHLKSTPNQSSQNILIIDDAIDTGRTMFIVKNNLNRLFPNSQIKTAVISWTIENSIIQPDYYLFKNTLVRFPWSKDYKGKDFEKKSFSS